MGLRVAKTEEIENLLRFCKAMGEEHRFRIVKLLKVRELCVCEIASVLGLAISTVSKHLQILRDAGLIEEHKEGKWVIYRLRNQITHPCIAKIFALLLEARETDPLIAEDRRRLNHLNSRKCA